MTATQDMQKGEGGRTGILSSLSHLLPVMIGVGLFALGVFALYRLLKPVDAADVIAQVRATPSGQCSPPLWVQPRSVM